MKTIELTPEQAEIHLVALGVHIGRMKRRIEGIELKIAEHRRNGEVALAIKLNESKNLRLQMIADTKKELARMRHIFGGNVKNG